MIKIRRESYPKDVTRIQQAIIHAGYLDCSRLQAAEAWRDYSNSMAAGWLMFSDDCTDKDLWECVEPFIEAEDE